MVLAWQKDSINLRLCRRYENILLKGASNSYLLSRIGWLYATLLTELDWLTISDSDLEVDDLTVTHYVDNDEGSREAQRR